MVKLSSLFLKLALKIVNTEILPVLRIWIKSIGTTHEIKFQNMDYTKRVVKLSSLFLKLALKIVNTEILPVLRIWIKSIGTTHEI